VLEERLRLRRIAKYGPGSEKLSDLQLQFLEEEPGVSQQEVAAESEREPLPAGGDDEKKRNRRPHPGRQTLPADLPRVEKVIARTPAQCVCGNCGKQTVVIGYEVSEGLNVKPAEYFVEVTKRGKRACKQKQCEEQGVEPRALAVERTVIGIFAHDGVDDDWIGKMPLMLRRHYRSLFMPPVPVSSEKKPVRTGAEDAKRNRSA
jgi:hypothetical protein